MFFYPPASPLDEHPDLLCITTAAYHFHTLPLSVHFLHDAHRGTTRFVQLLLNKHDTKIADFLYMASIEVEYLGELPPKNSFHNETR